MLSITLGTQSRITNLFTPYGRANSELIAFDLPSICKTLQIGLGHNGGDEEIRTPDPLLARQVLSQLSYTPKVN